MKTPKVSILIPAFNAEKWIENTIRSAVAQTWEPKEIIIVDDGSTDRTLAIARQFESESVHVVSQKNAGAAAARNRAFSLSCFSLILADLGRSPFAPMLCDLLFDEFEFFSDGVEVAIGPSGRPEGRNTAVHLSNSRQSK